MPKIGVVGDKDSVLAFKAFGLSVFPAVASDSEASRKIVDKLAREDYGIIFVTEQIAETITETIDRYDRCVLPAIILIPGSTGSLGIGLARIRRNVEKAVGMNILDSF
ncbi:V-type ATP synthase subunit F [Clostridia bacterium]|nr:V-type ATP synthase subunit F [Clostridia bacterium]GHU77504.1 V-type ATP synthase subunit F [Clostridia bacterium]